MNLISKGLKSIAGIDVIVGNYLLVAFIFHTVRGMGIFHEGPTIICLLWTAVKVSSFPGCTAMDMRDHIKPILRRNPDTIVMHVGTNSLRSSASVRDCAEEIVNLATMISNESSADLTISSIILRSDDEVLAVKVSGVNKILKTFCNQNGWGYVDQSNISPEHDLNRSGLHLNSKGTARLATNFINYLRDD